MTQKMKTFTLGASEEHNQLAWLGLDVRLVAKEHGVSGDEAAKQYFPDRYDLWKEKVEGKRLIPGW